MVTALLVRKGQLVEEKRSFLRAGGEKHNFHAFPTYISTSVTTTSKAAMTSKSSPTMTNQRQQPKPCCTK